jgi:hypothetical protein
MTLSLDDHIIQMQRELYAVQKFINTHTYPSALASLDRIVEHANEAFSLIGAIAPDGTFTADK